MPRPTSYRYATRAALAAILALAGCGSGDDADTAPAAGTETEADSAADAGATGGEPVARPDARTDTVSIEGMPEPVELRLFKTPADFPLPFTAYVPAAMEPAVEESSARFVAAFGGTVNPDAFVHLFVFPAGTDRAHAVDAARAYKTGRGIPVSRGLEPIADGTRPPHLAWAIEAYGFRYQSEGRWYGGSIGVGRHAGRFYQIVRHYPVEYGDGFPPRSDLIMETWRWADGTGLEAGSE